MLRAAYQLRYHRLGGWSLEGWLLAPPWAAAALLALTAWRRLTWQGWAVVALLLLVGIVLRVLAGQAARQMYVTFGPEPALAAPVPQALHATDKVLLHATGQYEVEGKSHFFADLLAYWRTFATREHTVMAIVHRSRYLLVGRMPDRDIGMWYIFFKPQDVQLIVPGRLTFGPVSRPALSVTYLCPPGPPPSALHRLLRRPTPPRREARIYLAFDDEAGRRCVWADLLADG